MKCLCLDVKYNVIQMTSENNDLEFDQFKASLHEAIHELAPIKNGIFEQSKRFS